MNPRETQKTAPTLEDVWRLFAESDRRLQETERLLKEQSRETDRLFKEQAREFDRKLEESARERKEQSNETERLLKERSLETERVLKEQSNETERKLQETDRLLRQQSRETKRLEDLFTSQWGKLMESLVEGDIIGILTRFGVPVLDTSTRVKGRTAKGQQFEFDILAHNGEIVVVIEVKTTLRAKYVTHFIEKLNSFKTWLPRYANNRIYGAMAFLTADENSAGMAEKQGLIVIRATGDSASIVNQAEFKPRIW